MTEPITIEAFHGSGIRIDRFDCAFVGQGNDQYGSGFYFTTSLEQALHYTAAQIGDAPKPGGQLEPTVHRAQLSFNRLLGAEESIRVSKQQVISLLKCAPDYRDVLWNWGDLDTDGETALLALAASPYSDAIRRGPTLRALFSIANDFFRGHEQAFNRAMCDVLGIDGIEAQLSDCTHYVAFFPEQIQIIEHIPREEAVHMVQAADTAPRPKPA